MASPVSYDLQGQGGGTVLIGGTVGSEYSGNIRWIQVVNDAVLSFVESNGGIIGNAGGLEGITLPAGLGIGGNFSEVDVESGVVIVYFK
jgi:hypothetical protein